jgi:ornithine cyclodeaminase
VRVLGADAVAALGPAAAVRAITDALRGGLDPAADPPRQAVGTAHGQLLLMPAESGEWAGVKVVSVAPGNPGRGLPTIQAVYLLLDSGTLSPVAALDGTALTSLRTPAVSAVAVRRLAAPDAARLVVFGSGPQAWGHVLALRAVRPLSDVRVIGRDQGRAAAFAERVAAAGLPASVGGPDAVADADLVVCATTAAEPLFDGQLVPDGACVVAVGSHEPGRRELDARLLGRSMVVVEDAATALREAGDVVQAIADGALEATAPVALADVVTGRVSPVMDTPRVFKSVGMAWQDLVIAAEVHRRWVRARPR